MRTIILLITLITTATAFAQEGLYDNIEAYDYVEQCEDTCRHIHGIDISHYQGEVFWESVGRNRRIAYVYLKATEGGDNIDRRYAENIRYAHRHGLLVGSYHFFRPRTPIHRQLRNFANQCRLEDQDLIPLIDVETLGKLPVAAFQDSLMQFLQLVEEHYQVKPLVYSGRNFYNKYLQHLLDDYPLMIAMYNCDEPPILEDGHPVLAWQYTAEGHIDGINGYVDKSRFLGHHRLRELIYPKHQHPQEQSAEPDLP